MKTKMTGLFKDYRDMFKHIMNWYTGDSDPRYYSNGTNPVLGNEEGHHLYSAGHAISDAGWHGWNGDALSDENKLFQKIEISYLYLLKSLAEAIGYEFPSDQDVWKYHLKNIDTDNILKLKEEHSDNVS